MAGVKIDRTQKPHIQRTANGSRATIKLPGMRGAVGPAGGPIPAGGSAGQYPTPDGVGGYQWRPMPVVDARVFGAVGNGVTDDRAAIQSALDAVSSNGGGFVFLPAGTYRLGAALTLPDGVCLRGAAKRATTLKLANNANTHVVQAGDFDTNADGVSKSTPIGCKTGGLTDLTVDGNKANQTATKHGLAYYGIDLYLVNVEVKNCKGWGIYAESPGAAYSVAAGQNLQSSFAHIEVHDNAAGNITYNGQSDSTLLDIVCYETGSGAGQANFVLGTKATGVRIVGLHCWGVSDYGVIVKGATGDLRAVHVESAAVAKVRLEATGYFDGRVYEAGSNNAAAAFQIAAGLTSYVIRATVSKCDKVVNFLGGDGGHGLIDVLAYSDNNAAVLFDATPSRTNQIRAELWGSSASRKVTQNATMVADTAVSRYDFTSEGLNFAWWTDDGRTVRQFAVEHVAGANSYMAATGGTTAAGPAFQARGTATDLDLRLIPKGAGMVRFGTRTASADAPITGYIEVKDINGTVRRLAVIG